MVGSSEEETGRRRGDPRGAYGFRIEGIDSADHLLVPAPPGSPTLAVRWVEDTSLPPETDDAEAESTVSFSANGAVIDVGSSGLVEIEREPAIATFRIRAASDPRGFVHPYLGWAASIVARWVGREVFHAGAFVSGSSAWAILGSRTAGKSSLLAWLHARGRAIVADDLLVVADGTAFAGPRSLDLREEAAARLGVGEPLGRISTRDRWRIDPGPVPWQVPLAGFVFLAWSDRVEIAEVTGRDRLARLTPHLTIPEVPADPPGLFELAALPALELRRPRDWSALDAAGDALLAAIRR